MFNLIINWQQNQAIILYPDGNILYNTIDKIPILPDLDYSLTEVKEYDCYSVPRIIKGDILKYLLKKILTNKKI